VVSLLAILGIRRPPVRFCLRCPDDGVCDHCGGPIGDATRLLFNFPAGPHKEPIRCLCGHRYTGVWLNEGDLRPGYRAGRGFYLMCSTSKRHGVQAGHNCWSLGPGGHA